MVRPMAFLTDLATNATAHDIGIVIFSGNDDSLVPHFGSQSRSSRSLSLQLANTRIQLPSKYDVDRTSLTCLTFYYLEHDVWWNPRLHTEA